MSVTIDLICRQTYYPIYHSDVSCSPFSTRKQQAVRSLAWSLPGFVVRNGHQFYLRPHETVNNVLVNLRSAREYNGIVRRDIEIVVLIVAEQTSTNLFKLSLPARLLGKLNHRWLMRHYFNKSEDSAVGQLLTGYIDSWRDEFHLDLTFRVRVLGGRDVASLGIGTANALLTPADLLEAVIS